MKFYSFILGQIIERSKDGLIQQRSKPRAVFHKTGEDKLGVVPRTIANLFDKIDSMSEQNRNLDVTVSCSFIQIYNEQVPPRIVFISPGLKLPLPDP